MENNSNEKTNIKSAMGYIPFVAYVLYFVDDVSDSRYKMNLRYSMILCTFWIISLIILAFYIKSLMTLAYFIITALFGYKSYINEDIRIGFIDILIGKIFK